MSARMASSRSSGDDERPYATAIVALNNEHLRADASFSSSLCNGAPKSIAAPKCLIWNLPGVLARQGLVAYFFSAFATSLFRA
jgi:hypothetical protein